MEFKPFFEVGQRIIPVVSTQRLRAGDEYVVIESFNGWDPISGYLCTYVLVAPDGEHIKVNYGWLLRAKLALPKTS